MLHFKKMFLLFSITPSDSWSEFEKIGTIVLTFLKQSKHIGVYFTFPRSFIKDAEGATIVAPAPSYGADYTFP